MILGSQRLGALGGLKPNAPTQPVSRVPHRKKGLSRNATPYNSNGANFGWYKMHPKMPDNERPRGGIRVVNPQTSGRTPAHVVRCSLVYQNGAASFKREWMTSAPGRALRSSNQHCPTISHSSSVNPRRSASSGFLGRTPSTIAPMTTVSFGRLLYGTYPHNTWVLVEYLCQRIYL